MKKNPRRRRHRPDREPTHPDRLDRAAQRARIRDLQRRLLLPDDSFPAERDLDACEGFLRYLFAIEAEPTSTHARQLIADGIELPPPDTFTEETVHDKLWEVIRGLAARRCLLEWTNHLSDLALYRRLWEETLNEPTSELDDGMGDCACHIDLIGTGSEEDTRVYLQYYADEEERERWRREFPWDKIPPRLAPPFDRDRHLPDRRSLSR